MSLMRLAYASEATFHEKPEEQGVEPSVARILMASRRNNAKNQIVGGLYYGNGYFFQYLEGEEEAVEGLYDRISQDDRHRNVTTLIHESLPERTFSNWSMKYVPLSSDVQRFLDKNDMESFKPLNFNRPLCEGMIRVIRDSSEEGREIDHRQLASSRKARSRGMSPVSIGLAVAALGVVGVLVYASTLY